MLVKLKISNRFFRSNAVNKGAVMTSTWMKLYKQQLALKVNQLKNDWLNRQLHTKLAIDFTSFCQLNELTAVVMDYEDEKKRND